MTDQQELLVEDIENACIKAFEAGASESDILFRVEELLQAMMWSCTEKLEEAEDREALAIIDEHMDEESGRPAHMRDEDWD